MAVRHFRAMALFAAALPFGAVLLSVPAAPAQASGGDLTCSVNLEFYFDPALKADGSANVDITGTLEGCTSMNGRHDQLSASTIKATAQATATAARGGKCGLAISADGSGTLGWVSGATSSFALRITPGSSNGLSIDAAVSDGELKADSISLLTLGAQTNQKCGSRGLTTLSIQGLMTLS
ncbi:hypothetical protein DFR76_106523 [Nocardia pseudobrasiliensis]|uniref:Uncharacterized protein n=2 Tax=Nocardia pseudobrasiliensis TaxID=45979 RepID=A0A370I6B6_9NOCA|nr:hypothetical protein DFR76_106523 [Nocardia pseudobrasiliensis]